MGGVLLGLAAVGFADVVLLRDGTVRRGTVEGRSGTEVRLRIDREGIRAVVVIPAEQVLSVEREVVTTAPAVVARPAVVGGAATQGGRNVGAKNVVAPVAAAQGRGRAVMAVTEGGGKGSEDFLQEFAASLVGRGPDDPARLPGELRGLWKAVMEADASGDKAGLLLAMDALENVFRLEEHGQAVIDAVGLREKGVAFSTWMAQTRWELVSGKYRNGQFDWRDLRPNERAAMIGILRKATEPALEPLRGYFPAEINGVTAGYSPAQLAGIGVQNCLEVKEKALYASAVLLAQLRLEPEMPGVDRMLLTGQLAVVRRVLGRAMDLEPAARMALEKAEREKKAAEERARRAGKGAGG